MKCRSCSAEIDARAIVCYRCGAPTADPSAVQTQAAARRRTASHLVIWLVVAIVAFTVGIYLVYFRPV